MIVGINCVLICSNFLKHLLIVTSLILLTLLTSCLLILRPQFATTKYIMPAATECGVFSGIK